MKTLLVVMLCASTALADDVLPVPRPGDAPLVEGRSMIVEEGSIVPFRGVCLDEQEHVRRERINVRNAVVAETAAESVMLGKPAFVAIVVGIALVAAGASAGVTAWALKKP